MSVFHDEIEIEDFEYDEEEDLYTYPCPCGDEFIITRVKKKKLIFTHLFTLKIIFLGRINRRNRGSHLSIMLIKSQSYL